MDTEPAVSPSPAAPPVALCRLDALVEGTAIALDALPQAGGEPLDLILLRHAGDVRAFRNVCPHAGRRLDYAPGKFLLQRGQLICAVHGATFDAADGRCVAGPCRGEHLQAVAVRVDSGLVHLAPEPHPLGLSGTSG